MNKNQKPYIKRCEKSERLVVDLNNLLDFLVEAKRKTYAGDGTKIKKKDTSRHYVYEAFPYKYHDSYYGNLVDCGREIIYFQGKPIWGMCYHGGVIEGHEEKAKEIFDFLRKALRLNSREFPMRGPLEYSEANYRYTNEYSGDFFKFSGKEAIIDLNLGKPVYLKDYCGGLIKDRSYKVVFQS